MLFTIKLGFNEVQKIGKNHWRLIFVPVLHKGVWNVNIQYHGSYFSGMKKKK